MTEVHGVPAITAEHIPNPEAGIHEIVQKKQTPLAFLEKPNPYKHFTETHEVNGREHTRFTEDGRAYAQEQWQRALTTIDPQSSFEEIEDRLRPAIDALAGTSYDLEPELAGLLKRSFESRLWHETQKRMRAELDASNSPWLALVETMQTEGGLYENMSPKAAQYYLADRLIPIKHTIEEHAGVHATRVEHELINAMQRQITTHTLEPTRLRELAAAKNVQGIMQEMLANRHIDTLAQYAQRKADELQRAADLEQKNLQNIEIPEPKPQTWLQKLGLGFLTHPRAKKILTAGGVIALVGVLGFGKDQDTAGTTPEKAALAMFEKGNTATIMANLPSADFQSLSGQPELPPPAVSQELTQLSSQDETIPVGGSVTHTSPEAIPSPQPEAVSAPDPLEGTLRDPRYRIGNVGLESDFDFTLSQETLGKAHDSRIQAEYPLSPVPNYTYDRIPDEAVASFNDFDNNGDEVVVTPTLFPNTVMLIGHSYYESKLLPRDGLGTALPFHVLERLFESAGNVQEQTLEETIIESTDEFNGMELGTVQGEHGSVRLVVAGAYRMPTAFFEAQRNFGERGTDPDNADDEETSFAFRPELMGMIAPDENPNDPRVFMVACSGSLTGGDDHDKRVIFQLTPVPVADQVVVPPEVTQTPEPAPQPYYFVDLIHGEQEGVTLSTIATNADTKAALEGNAAAREFLQWAVREFNPSLPEDQIDAFINTFPVAQGAAMDRFMDEERGHSTGSTPPSNEDGNLHFLTATFHTEHAPDANLTAEEVLQAMQYNEIAINMREYIENSLGLKTPEEQANYILNTMRGLTELIQKKVMYDHGIYGNTYFFTVNGETANETGSPMSHDTVNGAFQQLSELISSETGIIIQNPNQLLSASRLETIDKLFFQKTGKHLWEVTGLKRDGVVVVDSNEITLAH